MQNAAKHGFGKKKRKSEDWFDDQDEEIQRLLNKILNGDKQALGEEVRKLKNQWFQEKAEAAERYSKEKSHREFYATLNAAYVPKSKNLHPVRTKDGELLLSPDDIKDRWIKHFSELLNKPTDVD